MIRRIRRRFRFLFDRETVAREVREELEFHIEMETAANRRLGMGPEKARRLALTRFGGRDRFTEQGLTATGGRWILDMASDLRIALRQLRRSPGFTMAVLLTIGIGVGITTGVFSVVRGVLLAPLPGREPGRLVRIYMQNAPDNRWSLSVADYLGVIAEQHTFRDVAAADLREVTLTGDGLPESIRAGFVTAGFFRTLGIPMSEGPGLSAGAGSIEEIPSVVLGASLRDRLFGPGRPVIGESLQIDGQAFRVDGVLAAGTDPMPGRDVEIWPTLTIQPPQRRGPFFLRVFGRLDEGVPLEAAAEDLAGISERLYEVWASTFQDAEAGMIPVPMREAILGDIDRPLLFLFGAVLFLLALAVTNVVNLMLARGTSRSREMLIRTCLGASRSRLGRQLVAEGLLIAFFSVVTAILIANALMPLIHRLGAGIPRIEAVGMDPYVLGFACVSTALAGLLAGIAPLLLTLSPRTGAGLRGGDRAISAGRGWQRLRGLLVAGEFALVLPLLVAAVLLVVSLSRLQEQELGFDPSGVEVARVALAPALYPGEKDVAAFWDRTLNEVWRIDGVETAAVATGLPPSEPVIINNFDLVDRPVPPRTSQPVAPWLFVSPGYFDALRVPLLAGRPLRPSDDDQAPQVILVSRRWAEQFYPGEEAVGRQLYSGGDTTDLVTVVGVVGDVKYTGLETTDHGVVFQPYTQFPSPSAYLVVRHRGPPGIMEKVRRVVSRSDPLVALTGTMGMEEKVGQSIALPMHWATLLSCFALIGLALSVVGIHGVLTYLVGRRRREMGIRMALGAQNGEILRAILGTGMGYSALGLAAGLAATVILTRWIQGMLYEVRAADPALLAAVVAFLLAVAFVACLGPAFRATHVDPVSVLAEE